MKVMVFLDWLARRFLYQPSFGGPAGGGDDSPEGSIQVRFGHKGDPDRFHGLFWDGPDGASVILYFHGNAGNVFEWAPIRDELGFLQTGFFLVDFPGYGLSRGRPSEKGLYRCALDAVKYLARRKIGPSRTVVWGRSMGGSPATFIASRIKFRGLVLESTFTSFPDVARTIVPFVPSTSFFSSERHHSLERVPRVKCPVLGLHGTSDRLIPFEHGKLLNAAVKSRKKFISVEGAGHNDVFDTGAHLLENQVKEWFATLE